MTREEQIEANRAGYRAAIAKAEAEGKLGLVNELTKALRSLEQQWAGECPYRRGAESRRQGC